MSESILPPPLPDAIPPDRVVGITTTVPVEVIFAAGLLPVDLNNAFVASEDPPALVREAERAGFPQTCCCWTRGLYGAAHRLGLRRLIGVTQGDCSNTHALMEALSYEGAECIPFEFPYRSDGRKVRQSIADLARELGADMAEARRWQDTLRHVRLRAAQIDRLSWEEGKVTGFENHLWLVSTSDFCTDPDAYLAAAERFVQAAGARPPIARRVRLAYVGVPPIVPALYDHLEAFGALVVLNEMQRQFAMPGPRVSLGKQYARYTYPYGIFSRLEDIRRQCALRRVDGIIHYVQSFCFRRIEDRILRAEIGLPVLTVECDTPGPLSGQLKTRLEAFVQMLEAKNRGLSIF